MKEPTQITNQITKPDCEEITKSLIKLLSDNTLTKINGQTPLMWLIQQNLEDSALALIATGKSLPKYLDGYLQTALYMAINKKMKRVALALIPVTIGKLQTICTLDHYFPKTPLMLACFKAMEDVALALIATGKSGPEIVSISGKTPIYYACENKLEAVALALIATNQSNPENCTNYGHTALMSACERGLENVALALVATSQSNPDKINNGGLTALIYACQYKLEKVAMALLESGKSNYQAKTHSGFDAYHYAQRNGWTSICQKIDELKNPKPTPDPKSPPTLTQVPSTDQSTD